MPPGPEDYDADGSPKSQNTERIKLSDPEKSREPEPYSLAEARRAVDTNATEAQRKAGNYAKGHVSWNGLGIAIENPKGSTRSGVAKDGKAWSVKMKADYGYIKGYKGADKEHVDVFIGPDPESDLVVIIDQNDPATGKFDECKVVIGVTNVEEAKSLYESNYSKGWKGFRQATPMSMPAFRQWLDRADKRKPVEPYAREAARLRYHLDRAFCDRGIGSAFAPSDEARLARWLTSGIGGQIEVPDRFGQVYRYSRSRGNLSVEKFQARVPKGSK